MGSYVNKIFHLYPNATDEDFRLEDDGTGVILKEWNEGKLGTKPTFGELDSQVDDTTADNTAIENKARAELGGSKKDKLLLEINFDQENRTRVLEGKSTITKQQYIDALTSLYKTL
ncbi:MAG: hypothetical protein GY774_16585 [Planctomycetes bacterium]|nr:hypothetical protein [Planctomycetota bacterium]